jgi:glycosyltransferase involved in cell wall biosynthesis
MASPDLFVVGRFPPPLDGQSLATQRLATLLRSGAAVEGVDLNPGGEALVQSRVRFRTSTVWHFVRERRRLQERMSAAPRAPALWTTISPTPLGHFRDVFTVAPAFLREQRVFAAVHNGSFDRVFQSPLTRHTARRLVKRLNGLVFLSKELAHRCAPWVPDAKRFIIPNTIDEALLCSEEELTDKQAGRCEERARSSQRTLRLLYFSHMIPSKGYEDVLEAVHLLHRRGRAITADFVGRWDSDERRCAFEDAVRDYALDGVVTHHGGIDDRKTARALYLAADVFLLPTTYPTEAQPLTVIEALNAGTPVVVTQHASLPEMIREGREGHFVPPHDPSAIATAVERFFDIDHWKRLSVGARTRFETVFSPGVVRMQWEMLLSQSVLVNP